MKGYLRHILMLIVLLFSSCSENEKKKYFEYDTILKEFEEKQSIPVRADNRDSLLQSWKNRLTETAVKQNNLYSAKAQYQIARLYGMAKQSDSAAIYLEKAFERIEAEPGNLEDKARIYQGIGNLSLTQGQLHRGNYYYNKAAAIVLADSLVALEVNAKIAILLAAAQSNQQFHRFELAMEMNKKALNMAIQLPERHINRQRPLTQLIQTFYHSQAPIDSLAHYVKLLEDLQQQLPKSYDEFFVFEGKTLYYDLKKEPDSVLKYQILKTDMQEMAMEANPNHAVTVKNLFISYVNIAGLYTDKKQLDKAGVYFQKAERLIQQHPAVVGYDHAILYHKYLADYYSKSRRLDEALSESREVAKIQEELYNMQNTQAIAEMSSLYEIQAQERSINQLNESLQIKELELQRNQLGMILSFLVVIMLLMILYFIYYGFRERRIRQEKDQVILQQQLLRTQMEPHFIFNTLTALQSYIRQGKTAEAINYLKRFSKLLRNSLELSREESVSLEEEIETLEDYLSLQQMRFENAFTYRINLTAGLETSEIRIPPMLIQPFVENAILHGVDMNADNGFVQIRFSTTDDLLQAEIRDSGRKAKPFRTEKHRSLSGIISRERLSLLGDEARIETFRNENGGTTVNLFIPLT